MLIEVRSTVLRTGHIAFSAGLNVVLGDDNATNSIGKSTLLMVIDFGFGGDSLLDHNNDLVSELGHHDYFFSFRFGSDTHVFRRGTYEPRVVYVCDERFEVLRALSLEEYTATLKHSYAITLPDLSFRGLVGLYLRVWGKENLDVNRPLHVFPAQSSRDCVNTLIKTFDRYDSIRDLTDQLDVADTDLKSITAATKHGFLPDIGKREYKTNQNKIADLEREIDDIRGNLAKYATNLSEVVNRETLELKIEKDRLLAYRQVVTGRLERVRRNLRDNRHITSKSFRELVDFFPEVNQERLAQVEEFHSGVARLLRTELKHSEAQLIQQTEHIDTAIRELDARMAQTLSSVEEPGHLVDRVVNVTTALQGAREANQKFDDERARRENVKALRKRLSEEKAKVLTLVEGMVNDGMRRIVSSVFGEERKTPRIGLRDGSYSFDVHDDTGTGTAYASLVVFDLTVFLSSQLPVIVHDSVLFKNIENDSVARLLRVYLESQKQAFIAMDEIQKYGTEAAGILRARSAIQLDDHNVLYVKDWRTKA